VVEFLNWQLFGLGGGKMAKKDGCCKSNCIHIFTSDSIDLFMKLKEYLSVTDHSNLKSMELKYFARFCQCSGLSFGFTRSSYPRNSHKIEEFLAFLVVFLRNFDSSSGLLINIFLISAYIK
jgi:hypothetical protein